MHTFPLSSMSLPTDPIVSTNSATSRSSVAIPINMQLVSSQNSGPGHKTAVLRSQNSCEFKSNATTVSHGTISHLPQENSRSVSSSISLLSNSLLIFSTLCCLLSSSRSVFLGSYLMKKTNKQKNLSGTVETCYKESFLPPRNEGTSDIRVNVSCSVFL